MIPEDQCNPDTTLLKKKGWPKPKTIHRASKIRPDGAVSAVCYSTPRAIDLKRATWTLRADAVTCPKCMELQQYGKS